MTSRRAFLRAAAGSALALAAPRRTAGQALPPPVLPLPPLPRANGAINVQPLRRFEPGTATGPPVIVPELVDLQLRALYELGFARIRLTLSWNRFGDDFFAAIPYVRAARALGLDVLGIVGQFAGLDLAQALSLASVRGPLLRAYLQIFGGPLLPAPGVERAGSLAFQILNEPTQFLGVPPGVYVRRLLAPAYSVLKDEDPELVVVSAAEVGTAEGVLRQRVMFESGLEDFCDRVAYHIYDRAIIPRLAGMARKGVWVTESGADGTDRHLAWVTQVFPEIESRIPGVEQVFYFQLYDRDPGRYRLLDIVQETGGFQPVVESRALVEHFADRVRRASGDVPRASYRDLVPDVTLYFPTAEDLEVIAAVPKLPIP